MFPILMLSTLHSLPLPIPRHGHKVYKPTWFGLRMQELEVSDVVGDILGWLRKGMAVSGDIGPGLLLLSVLMGKWIHANVAIELGGWLCGLGRCGDVSPVWDLFRNHQGTIDCSHTCHGVLGLLGAMSWERMRVGMLMLMVARIRI